MPVYDHPSVRAVMDRLECDMQEILLPHLIRAEDSVIVLDSMAADMADRLICRVLDKAQEDGEITGYEYGSVLDFSDHTLHASIVVLFRVVPERIMISFSPR